MSPNPASVPWRYGTGSPWRDLPEEFGPWQTVWKRHFRYSTDGTDDAILTAVNHAGLVPDDMYDKIEQFLAADSTVVRAHQHAAGARKDSVGTQATGHPQRSIPRGGLVELSPRP
ncbi:transposase [Brevibacterium aurantiacum]|uniref:transposase n=1 Tax=Brevibacterium aurantiacum TaxID=273384 RepID=UPI001D0265A8|nr:transposase [Brevibacterium aurantiacum]